MKPALLGQCGALMSRCWRIELHPCVTDLLLVTSHVLTIPCHFKMNSLLITYSTQMIPIFFYHKVPPHASFGEDGEKAKQNLTVVL